MSTPPIINSALTLSHNVGETFNYELIVDKGIRIEWDLSSVEGVSTVDGNDRFLTGGVNLALGTYQIPVKAINYYGEDSQILQLSVVEEIVDPVDPQVIDLFLIGGQSNGHGYALVDTLQESQKIQNGYFYASWHQFPNNGTTTQHFSSIETSITAGNTRSEQFSSELGSTRFGPEIGFAARANEISLTSNPIGIIKYAIDGSSLNTQTESHEVSDWDLYATDGQEGDAWRGFKAALADGVAKYEAAGFNVNFKGMIWWQGENGTSVSGLNDFIAAVRNHLANTFGLVNPSQFPIVITGQDGGWGEGLLEGVADIDPYVEYVESKDYGQTNVGGVYNIHIGSNEGGAPVDTTGSGNNDMYDIGLAYADKLNSIINGDIVYPTTYTITFVNVDDSVTTQTVEEGVTPTPPEGINTSTRTFTDWGTIEPATADVTYTASYNEIEPTIEYTITFVNVDNSVTIQVVQESVVATPPAGINTSTRTFTGWPTVDPATSDATYIAEYTVNEGSGDAWTPAQLTSAHWWDASDLSTITSSNGVVSDWTDKNQFVNVYQTNSYVAPKTGNSTINGLNVFDFDGNDFFRGPVLSFADFSKFVVFSRNTHAANNNLLSNVGGNADALWSGGTDKVRMYEGGAQIVASTPLNIDQVYICGSTKNSTTAEIELYLDGNLEATGSSSLATSDQQMQIGSFMDANNLNGKLAEVIILPTEATTEDRQKIEGYLANKWGISLPAGHPYESSAPTV